MLRLPFLRLLSRRPITQVAATPLPLHSCSNTHAHGPLSVNPLSTSTHSARRCLTTEPENESGASKKTPRGTGSREKSLRHENTVEHEHVDSKSKIFDRQPNDWDCPGCGTLNFGRRGQCYKCGHNSPKLSGDDWTCPECAMHNFARNVKCRRCGGLKDPSMGKPRGWVCPGCGEANGTTAGKCKSCNARNPQRKPGDWDCAECGSMNFYGRLECVTCGAPTTNAQRGEWSCPSCKSRVPNQIARCPECKFERPKSQARNWICLGCGGENFENRKSCFLCGDEKPGDWNCTQCGFFNFRKRTECGQCKAPKPVRQSDTNYKGQSE